MSITPEDGVQPTEAELPNRHERNAVEAEFTPEQVEQVQQASVVTTRSLKDRLRERREKLFADRSVVMPVLGYEDEGLFVRYRILTYGQMRSIGEKNKKLAETQPIEHEVAIAADTLIYACVELLEKRDDGDGNEMYSSLGGNWTADSVREIFGLDLGPNTTAREALRAVMPDTIMMIHFRDFDTKTMEIAPEVGRVISGESEPSAEG